MLEGGKWEHKGNTHPFTSSNCFNPISLFLLMSKFHGYDQQSPPKFLHALSESTRFNASPTTRKYLLLFSLYQVEIITPYRPVWSLQNHILLEPQGRNFTNRMQQVAKLNSSSRIEEIQSGNVNRSKRLQTGPTSSTERPKRHFLFFSAQVMVLCLIYCKLHPLRTYITVLPMLLYITTGRFIIHPGLDKTALNECNEIVRGKGTFFLW